MAKAKESIPLGFLYRDVRRSRTPQRHPTFVATHPNKHGIVVILNVTHDKNDTSCKMFRNDSKYFDGNSYVRFADGFPVSILALFGRMQDKDGGIKQLDVLTSKTVRRVHEAARKSDKIPDGVRDLVTDCDNECEP